MTRDNKKMLNDVKELLWQWVVYPKGSGSEPHPIISHRAANRYREYMIAKEIYESNHGY